MNTPESYTKYALLEELKEEIEALMESPFNYTDINDGISNERQLAVNRNIGRIDAIELIGKKIDKLSSNTLSTNHEQRN